MPESSQSPVQQKLRVQDMKLIRQPRRLLEIPGRLSTRVEIGEFYTGVSQSCCFLRHLLDNELLKSALHQPPRKTARCCLVRHPDSSVCKPPVHDSTGHVGVVAAVSSGGVARELGNRLGGILRQGEWQDTFSSSCAPGIEHEGAETRFISEQLTCRRKGQWRHLFIQEPRFGPRRSSVDESGNESLHQTECVALGTGVFLVVFAVQRSVCR